MLDFRLIILSYNHPQITAQAVNSALSQVEPEKIILFHNGSKLENVEFLKKTFPQILHASSEENKGYSGGANCVLSFAFKQAPWAFFMTNDCYLLKLNQPVNAEPSLVAPLVYLRNKNNIDSIGGVFDVKKSKLSHCKGLKEFKSCQKKITYVPGSAFWLHKNIFESLNGFDESFHTYWEDVDFSIRAKDKGYLISADLETQVLHKGGKTCHKDSFYTSYLFQRNRIRVAKKYSKHLSFLYKDLFFQFVRHVYKKKWQNLKYLAKAISHSKPQ
ncbi:MAG: glycosyltransferase [Oligoflexia bacterium]|nr:glycosyltransferase [Oligoflexia bacterium]